MTTSSKSRLQRRQAKKSAMTEAPKAIITLTEAPGGGFTVGLGLHGAKMNELYPDKSFPVSIVDVIALAVSNIIQTQPEDFRSAVNLVNETLRSVTQQLEAGEAEDAIADAADEALAGAVSTVEG
ncbi:hypothetical protein PAPPERLAPAPP_05290 [Brevundimonas phage vB_BpoS-Papperlapapp]|uniref:Uncharacterized protein n=2 Tax=Marchewkavirus TaxID=3425052 RepID=A0A9E7SK67_9CAUD|nr:hypothetical protein KABACHOK_03660 [Brevundimonas phage vB_BpoS-Kabachok]USN14894.1 hypothetical protein DOMOVOI_04230 [Brevundimonas phage vB_BpoS-Domovoi]USN16267.1 hypothetical protein PAPPERLAPAPP_05290 [Brevundimonas phage vB_BpoS-Papperlapapp]